MSTLQQRRPEKPQQQEILQPHLGPSDTTPVVSSNVIKTLLGFTAAMALLPIGSYFFTLKYVFSGNSTFAGGFAALMANVVLFGYVAVAWMDDQEDQSKGVAGTGVRGEAKKEK